MGSVSSSGIVLILERDVSMILDADSPLSMKRTMLYVFKRRRQKSKKPAAGGLGILLRFCFETACNKVLAERTGLEPATPGVTGRYSNQLNYHSIFASFCNDPDRYQCNRLEPETRMLKVSIRSPSALL